MHCKARLSLVLGRVRIPAGQVWHKRLHSLAVLCHLSTMTSADVRGQFPAAALALLDETEELVKGDRAAAIGVQAREEHVGALSPSGASARGLANRRLHPRAPDVRR